MNLRKVGNRVKTYAASIKEKGILQGVRGEPWVVYDPSSECYLCISYGSLTSGCNAMFFYVFISIFVVLVLNLYMFLNERSISRIIYIVLC